MTTDTPPRPPNAAVAIVTVSYNSGRYLAEFLASTYAASTGSTRVVVADNASRDEAEARRITEAAGAIFLPMGSNRGYGYAVNRAVETLPPAVEWVLISNPDVVLEPGSVDELLRVGAAEPTVGAVGPAIQEPDGEYYPSARQLPSLRNGLGHALFANIWPSNPWTRRYRREGQHDAVRSTGWLSGACVLVRRSLFDALGGFDEEYFMYFEDVDLGFRITRAGYRNLYQPAARVMHVGAHATRESSDQMRRAHHRSAYRFLALKYSGWYLAPLRWVLGIGLGVRSRLPRRTP
ncbi:glycosyltransferase family 2 protein [Planctomonas psychrotolerans]|uniref:glycosyltransferase family 2 protein n=1 Tax=Planctomonas psychrotolerans TaxID=2528712 RepID=UPI00123B3C26|nr:glycosyltransferase family 2 protein [Planctomonas psychrotolerans]